MEASAYKTLPDEPSQILIMTNVSSMAGLHTKRLAHVILVAVAAILLNVGAGVAQAEDEIAVSRWQLKYLPVVEFLPLVADALERLQGVAAANAPAKQDGLSDGVIEADPRAVRVGSTLLVSDAQLNAIIVAGDAESLAVVKSLIDELDCAPLQVRVSVIIAEVRLDDGVKSALDPIRGIKSVKVDDAWQLHLPTEPTRPVPHRTGASYQLTE